MENIRGKDVQQECRLLKRLAESLRRASLTRFMAKPKTPPPAPPKLASGRNAKAA